MVWLFTKKVWLFELAFLGLLVGAKNMGDYHDLYLITDTLLLCDIFENWQNISLEHYGLDPASFPTAPSLSWNAAFKKTICPFCRESNMSAAFRVVSERRVFNSDQPS